MAKAEDVCADCSKKIFGRQQYLECCGDCDQRFNCKCINVTAEDYDVPMASGRSKYKCKTCTRRRNSVSDTPPLRKKLVPRNQRWLSTRITKTSFWALWNCCSQE
ncbi:unnamed protein product [Ixodes hexagonus]